MKPVIAWAFYYGDINNLCFSEEFKADKDFRKLEKTFTGRFNIYSTKENAEEALKEWKYPVPNIIKV